MSDSKDLANHRNQEVRIQCIDYATRIVGKPTYVTDKSGVIRKHQDDVIETAERIHKFVTG